jgi:hypothetical protein
MALIGDKTFGQWEQSYKDAYMNGGIEAENAARAQYQAAANAMTPQSQSSYDNSILSGINYQNGGVSNVPQNYSNANDPFTVGYGTANPSAGMQAPATNTWQANTKPQSLGGLAGAMGGGQGINAYQGGGFSGVGGQPLGGGTANPYMPAGQSGQNKPMPYNGDMGGSMGGGNASPYPMGGVPQAMQSNMQGGLEVNPYLSTMGANLTNEITSNFNRNVMPGMRSQMMAAGGIGGSREGVLQANALRDMNSTIGNALGNLYGQGYVQAGNQALGQGNLQLGYGNLDRNLNNDNLNWQLQGANFGLGIQDRLNNSNAIGLGAGQSIQDTPLNYYNNFADRANAIGQGFASTSQSGGGGSALTGALGGAQLGRQIGNWWNTSNQPPAADPLAFASGNGRMID